MRLTLGLLTALLWLSPGLLRAGDLPIGRNVGRGTPNFTLKDVRTGQDVSLYGFRGKNAAVIVFTGTSCPVNDLYMPRLVELAKEYEPKGVVFLAINANAPDTPEEVAAHAKQFGVEFPVLKDPENKVADLLLAQSTCEVLVADGRAVLRYRGAIDDQYDVGKRKDRPTHSYLVDAIDSILSHREIETTATTVAGCPIERAGTLEETRPLNRVRPAPQQIVDALAERDGDEPVDVGQVTYAANVASIMQEKCQSCHRPGAVGPFSLLTYEDVKRHKTVIREVVEEFRMPPWHADPRFGHFGNDRSLSRVQRATILAWIDQGTPLGDPSKLPEPKPFPDHWTVGAPDVVFSIPADYVVAATGELPYQRFIVPTGFTEDKWVESIEARPGDSKVVHHIIVYLLDKDGRGAEHLGGYAPGDMPSVYPPGTAKRIPAGGKLVFEIHYTPVGKIHIDRSSVGLIFAKAPVEYQARTRGIANNKFAIPPGATNHEVKSEWTVGQDAHLLSFMPHMHLRGKDFLYEAQFPDGRRETLLSVPAYDFGWQSYYRLAEPLALPKGTKILCTAHFDNSASNPANPDPSATVRWGDQTREEMMIGYVDIVSDEKVSTASAPAKPGRSLASQALRLIKRSAARVGTAEGGK
jgi:thiol-disulfide isomerase/thioredoxin